MKELFQKYIDLKNQINNLEDQVSHVINEVLDYKFPNGKYKGESMYEVMLADPKYCFWGIKQNEPENENLRDIVQFPMILNSAAHYKMNMKRIDKEDEYERRRMKYCEDHNENYGLDYEIRHNINLRDFEM